jgi:anti-sigma factor RsiW
MSCNRMENKILPYVDGRLKPSEMRDMEKHLAACPACRLRVNEFRALSGLLDELPQIEPSGAFDARVRARVAAEPVRRSWWAVFAPSVRVVCAAAMLVVATVWLGSRPSDSVVGPNAEAEQEALVGDLPVLENFDVLSNFDALSDLPLSQSDDASQQDANPNTQM